MVGYGRFLKQRAESLLTGAKFLLHLLTVGDVFDGAFKIDLAIVAAKSASIQRNPDSTSILAKELTFKSPGFAALLEKSNVLCPLFRIDIQLIGNILYPSDELLRTGVTQHSRQ